MERRTILAGFGAGTTVLGAGCSGLLDRSEAPTHLVRVANGRETSHEAFVEVEFDGEQSEDEPRTLEPGDNWEVERFESRGTLRVPVLVDGETVWDDTHEIPTPGGDRRSFARVELRPDDEVRAQVKREDWRCAVRT